MRTKVKGFTLIELIVVMAVFSVIMVAAMQLLGPTTKVMRVSEIQEESNAVVSNISAYIKSELAPAEYLTVYNGMPEDDAVMEQYVEEFAQSHYAGVLKGGSPVNPASATYADGTVHVMVINNETNGRISSKTYSYGFSPTVSKTSETALLEDAVNKACYENYRFKIRFGYLDSTADFNVPQSYLGMSNEISAASTKYTIQAITERNHEEYAVISKANITLTNITERSNAAGCRIPAGFYYALDQVQARDADNNPLYETEADGVTLKKDPITNADIPVMEDGILDVCNAASTSTVAHGDAVEKVNASTKTGISGDGYFLIYSYRSDINT